MIFIVKKIIAVLFILSAGFLLFYLGMPVVNFGFVGLPITLLVLTSFWIIVSTSFEVSPKTKQLIVKTKPKQFLFLIVAALLLYLIVFPLLTSLPMFRSESYQKMIGKVVNGEKISNHIASISIDEIRVVDEDLAHLLGEKVLGSQPALGSQVELGAFCIQKVNKELYWVAPLLHSGFFKWMNNQEGTAGYVMVSATNERDVKLVQTSGGKPIRIKYQPEAYFQSNIERHLYASGYATVGLADYSFEIDDEGTPFWVVTKYEKKIGFSGNDASGIILVNAQTGEIKEH